MIRKHFKAFAKEVAQVKDKKTRMEMAIVIARVCYDDNHLFDIHRFYKACDVPELS